MSMTGIEMEGKISCGRCLSNAKSKLKALCLFRGWKFEESGNLIMQHRARSCGSTGWLTGTKNEDVNREEDNLAQMIKICARAHLSVWVLFVCSHDFIGEFTTSYRELSRGQNQFNVYEVRQDNMRVLRCVFIAFFIWRPYNSNLGDVWFWYLKFSSLKTKFGNPCTAIVKYMGKLGIRRRKMTVCRSILYTIFTWMAESTKRQMHTHRMSVTIIHLTRSRSVTITFSQYWGTQDRMVDQACFWLAEARDWPLQMPPNGWHPGPAIGLQKPQGL